MQVCTKVIKNTFVEFEDEETAKQRAQRRSMSIGCQRELAVASTEPEAWLPTPTPAASNGAAAAVAQLAASLPPGYSITLRNEAEASQACAPEAAQSSACMRTGPAETCHSWAQSSELNPSAAEWCPPPEWQALARMQRGQMQPSPTSDWSSSSEVTSSATRVHPQSTTHPGQPFWLPLQPQPPTTATSHCTSPLSSSEDAARWAAEAAASAAAAAAMAMKAYQIQNSKPLPPWPWAASSAAPSSVLATPATVAAAAEEPAPELDPEDGSATRYRGAGATGSAMPSMPPMPSTPPPPPPTLDDGLDSKMDRLESLLRPAKCPATPPPRALGLLATTPEKANALQNAPCLSAAEGRAQGEQIMHLLGEGERRCASGRGSGRRRAAPAAKSRLFCYLYLHMSDNGFQLVPTVIGRNGCNTRQIYEATGCKVRVRGKGSGHKESSTGKEAPTPLMMAITSESFNTEGFYSAVRESIDLLRCIEEKYATHCAERGLPAITPGFTLGSTCQDTHGELHRRFEGILPHCETCHCRREMRRLR
eukprot:TRINITY_DN34490_c0_g1_i1.p1 TRINITY_DN34490_c0_g1~~TRINITY_DN34490_c0_g1_i1.p1  ORF type:complete len:536 (+),score=94.55 TRINITY_DN34490_c0_g1_i1:106-1713(+)